MLTSYKPHSQFSGDALFEDILSLSNLFGLVADTVIMFFNHCAISSTFDGVKSIASLSLNFGLEAVDAICGFINIIMLLIIIILVQTLICNSPMSTAHCPVIWFSSLRNLMIS